MALDKPYKDIPGTTIFDSDQARLGYHVNQFCMTLMKPENRERFLENERAYLDEWPMSEAQKRAVLDRDYNALLKLGANVYYFGKLFFTDKISFEKGASLMAGMSQDDYREMMVSGGRSPDGNRFIGEKS
ncbi:MAG: protocatechuate 4,5-dioxygenase subunit alpha [Proteobacteria bacterium]|nr:protocatechuate 4,5-dioxygenase subunit alpha [Pseudomonadota bacterium]MDA0992608.1 protocatechuate 4,5-dioxygenase subunit alpha [Pseudomonadota bacterium]